MNTHKKILGYINRTDRQITFPGSAYPKEIFQQCTPDTHTEAVHCQRVLLGVFHSSLWPLKAPGSTVGDGHQPLVSSLTPEPPSTGIQLNPTHPSDHTHFSAIQLHFTIYLEPLLLKHCCTDMNVATYQLRLMNGSVRVFNTGRLRASRWQHRQVNHAVVGVNHAAVVSHAQRRQHVVTCTTQHNSSTYLTLRWPSPTVDPLIMRLWFACNIWRYINTSWLIDWQITSITIDVPNTNIWLN